MLATTIAAMSQRKTVLRSCALVSALVINHGSALAGDDSTVLGSAQGSGLTAQVYADGTYTIAMADHSRPVIRSTVEAVVDGVTLSSAAYPRHEVGRSEVSDSLGAGSVLTVTHRGRAGQPDLVASRLMHDQAWGEVSVEVNNTTGHPISVHSIRSVHSVAAAVVDLGGPAASDRVLSDSFSEDRPQLTIRDLSAAPAGLHRAVGSQLIYNRRSGESLFFGALTSERFLTIFHLKARAGSIVSYDADSTGTTEILKGESLRKSPAADQIRSCPSPPAPN